MRKMQINDWRQINWNEFAQYHEGWTGLFLYTRFRIIVNCYVPKIKRKNFTGK